MQPGARRSSVATAGMGLDWLAGAGSADSSSSGAYAQQHLGYGQTEHAHMLTAIRQVSSGLLC